MVPLNFPLIGVSGRDAKIIETTTLATLATNRTTTSFPPIEYSTFMVYYTESFASDPLITSIQFVRGPGLSV